MNLTYLGTEALEELVTHNPLRQQQEREREREKETDSELRARQRARCPAGTAQSRSEGPS